jgi:enoyl-CoA hydratase
MIGRGKALELMLTADMITAQEAKALGLVNHVVSNKDDLLDLAMVIMKKIIANAPVAIANIIKSVNAGYEFENIGYRAEAENFGACFETEDFKEGTNAFIQKRKPNFSGK